MKTIIYGSLGTMGQLATAYFKSQNIEVIEVDVFGQNQTVYTDIKDVSDADVIIDFSHPSQIDALLTYAIDKKIPLVIATTGYNETQTAQIHQAAKHIPIFKSANLSLGIHLLRSILKDYTKVLEKYYDIEIIEKHHRQKVDAPSGTAHLLLDTIQNASLHHITAVTDRYTAQQKRTRHEVGITSIRAGQIVGEHTVLFASDDDVIELTHKAQSKMMFVKGAWLATNFIKSQKPGLYTMDDIPLQEMIDDVNN